MGRYVASVPWYRWTENDEREFSTAVVIPNTNFCFIPPVWAHFDDRFEIYGCVSNPNLRAKNSTPKIGPKMRAEEAGLIRELLTGH